MQDTIARKLGQARDDGVFQFVYKLFETRNAIFSSIKGSFTNEVISLWGGGIQIMTARLMTGEGFLSKMTSFFTTIIGLIFVSFTTKFG